MASCICTIYPHSHSYIHMHSLSFSHICSVTPADYEPPGFQATKADEFSFKDEPMNIRVGDVATVSSLNPLVEVVTIIIFLPS